MSDAVPGFVYLASQSPRRGQLLEQIGVRYRLLLPAEGEDAEALEAERPGESPDDYVRRVTLAKLQAARARLARLDGATHEPRGEHPEPEPVPRTGQAAARPLILCADTTVALGGRILGKPRDAADAAATLRLLSGTTHRVLTAVAVGIGGVGGGVGVGEDQLAVSTSTVRIARLTEAAITAYVASGEPFGKAGAYGVQGGFAAWVERIEGSYSGIMGLPLFETARLLRSVGFGGV